jgi:hypothetical protein
VTQFLSVMGDAALTAVAASRRTLAVQKLVFVIRRS